MKLVVDALGAPATSGGMRVHAEEFLRAWTEEFPRDELVVVGYQWVSDVFYDSPNVKVVVVENARSRFFAQLFTCARVFRRENADILLSLSSMVSPFVSSAATACFIHDWRHILNPHEFGRAQRMYRSLWKRSIRHAGVTIAISRKTAAETKKFANPRRLVVAENGGDHPRRWSVSAPTPRDVPQILTFGHIASKRPELVVDAVADLRARGIKVDAVIVGARGEYRDQLAERARAAGVEGAIELPGFVPDEQLHALVSASSVVALVSSDEGYGMPVVEAAYFGIPAVVADDSGLTSVHGDAVISASPTAAGIAEAIEHALHRGVTVPGEVGQNTWGNTAASVRKALVENSVHQSERDV